MRICVIIPTYNHGAPLERTLESIAGYQLPIIVVDDGSNEADKEMIRAAASRHDAQLKTLPLNLGKGGAVMEGLLEAHRLGFTHAIQVDADGQHNAEDIALLIEATTANPEALVVGHPVFDESVPSSRLYGRRLTNFWVAIETLSMSMPDAMCGFRAYPLDSCLILMKSVRLTQRMDFDIEILVRLAWTGIPIVKVPTRVTYLDEGISNFRVWQDNWLISKLHTRLFFGMLWRLPGRLFRRVSPRRVHWSRIGERGGAIGMRFLFAVYRVLGRRVFKLVLFPVMGYFYLSARGARQSSQQYLQRIKKRTADEDESAHSKLTTFRHFLSFGDAVLDKSAMWAGAFDQPISFDEPQAYENFRAENRGSLFIGSHLGNLEVLRALGETTQGFTVNALVYTRHSRRFVRVLEEVNPLATEHMIEVDSLGPESILMLRDKIAQGEHVAIVGDRTSTSHEERSIHAEFLSDLAPFPEGPFIIAHLLACPVYLIFCLKQNGAYKIFLEKFADPLELPRSTRKQALEEAIGRYAQRLEHYCLEAPLQWFNFYQFWKSSDNDDDNSR